MCCVKVLIVNVSFLLIRVLALVRGTKKDAVAAPIPSGSITKQRLGIGYDRTGTVARAIMSCGERNQSTGDLS